MLGWRRNGERSRARLQPLLPQQRLSGYESTDLRSTSESVPALAYRRGRARLHPAYAAVLVNLNWLQPCFTHMILRLSRAIKLFVNVYAVYTSTHFGM